MSDSGYHVNRYELVTTRVQVTELPPGDRLDRPESVGPWLCRHLHEMGLDPSLEQVGILALDSRHRPIGWRNLGTGVRDQCPVDPKDVFRHSLAMDAAGVVLYHTHPSGDLEPSRDDYQLTRRLVECGRVLSLPLLDHFIVAASRWVTLRVMRPDLFSAAKIGAEVGNA